MINPCLAYEVLMYLNSYYFGTFVVCEITMEISKLIFVPTVPISNLLQEYGILLLLCAVESVRIYLGRKGNLTETIIPIIISIVLTFPSALGVVYFLLWQSYVLRLETILCSIQLVMLALEFVMSVTCIGVFYKCGTVY